jgi:hypothetical protein
MVDFARVQGGRQIQTGGILVIFRGFEFGAQRRNRVKDAVYGWARDSKSEVVLLQFQPVGATQQEKNFRHY